MSNKLQILPDYLLAFGFFKRLIFTQFESEMVASLIVVTVSDYPLITVYIIKHYLL